MVLKKDHFNQRAKRLHENKEKQTGLLERNCLSDKFRTTAVLICIDYLFAVFWFPLQESLFTRHLFSKLLYIYFHRNVGNLMAHQDNVL